MVESQSRVEVGSDRPFHELLVPAENLPTCRLQIRLNPKQHILRLRGTVESGIHRQLLVADINASLLFTLPYRSPPCSLISHFLLAPVIDPDTL